MFVDSMPGPALAERPIFQRRPAPPRPKAPGAAVRRPQARQETAADPSRLRNELLLAAAALACGLFVAPLLFWFAAKPVLGPYTHGQDLNAGPTVLLRDFLAGLSHGSLMFWIVAVGPVVMLTFARFMYSLLRPKPD
jgi:hypothetical protein